MNTNRDSIHEPWVVEQNEVLLSTNIEEFAYAAIAGPEQQHMQHLRVS